MNFIFVFLTLFTSAFAYEFYPIPENYLHIFTYEKNINSENIMVVHALADANCMAEVSPMGRTPIIDFYWLMNRSSYKPVNPIIKSNIHERMSATAGENRNTFNIKLEDLSEVHIDIPSTLVSVETFSNSNGKCEAVAKITLGESDGNVTLVLQKIFVDAKKTFNPLRPKVKSISLIGLDARSGSPITRTYEAK